MLTILVSLISMSAVAREFIVGGENVGPRDPVVSSTVGIYEPTPSGGSLCTGTLISKDTALTAAHCLGGRRPVVVFGRNLNSSGVQARPVERALINKKWRTHARRGMDQGDIAVVKFSGGLPEGYRKAPLLESEKSLEPGDKVTVAGYGINHAKMKTGSGRLRKTEIAIVKPRPGKTEMILDQTQGHGACHGDSGGPAYVKTPGGRWAVAGVTNRGHPKHSRDDCAHQVVYTKVPAYGRWIRSAQKKLHEPQESRLLAMKTKRIASRRRR